MKLKGRLTQEDFNNATLIKLNQIINIKLLYLIILFLCISLAVDLFDMEITFNTLTLVIMLVTFLYVRFIVVPKNASKMYKESNIAALLEIEIYITDAGIKTVSKNRETETNWQAIKGFSYDEKIIFIDSYGAPSTFISRSLVTTDDEWNKCISFLKTHLSSRKH